MNFNFSFILSSTDIEFIWSSLKSIILHSISIFTPVIKSKAHPKTKWINHELRHQLNKIHSLRKRCRINPTPIKIAQLSDAELQLQCNIPSARSSFEADIVTKFAYSDDNQIYKYIKSLSGHKGLPAELSYGFSIASTPTLKANFFNQFFSSVFTVHSALPSFDLFTSPTDSLSSINITSDETLTGILSLNPTKAMGGDGIPPLILKLIAPAILDPIHHLFSSCLSEGYLPKEWRRHYITLIHKSGARSQVSNYRSISLLCCISKVLERLIFDKVSDHIFNQLSDCQFGFCKNRSTLQQLLLYNEHLVRAYDNHLFDSIKFYLDVQKHLILFPMTNY